MVQAITTESRQSLGNTGKCRAYDNRSIRRTWISNAYPQSISQQTHKITQQPCPSPFSNVNRAALVAASKTSSTPSPVNDEHSRYFRAPISRAILLPSLSVVKCCDFFRISSWAIGSSRRSFFSPTRIMGTPGHLSLASSTHLERVRSEIELWLQRLAHLVFHVVEGVWCVDREAYQNDMCFRIGQRP